MNIKELVAKKERFTSGHRACAGCGFPQIVRAILAGTDKQVVVANATGCLEVVSTIYPFSSWKVPYIHSAFENVAATISGVERAYKILKKKRKIKDDVKFLAIAGDGGCYIPGTKVLTEGGFKNVEIIQKGEILWSVNPVTLELEKTKVERLHNYNYHNKILKVKHNFVNFEVSLNHNIPIWDKLDKKLKFIKAQQLINYGRSDRINILTGNFIWRGNKEKWFNLPPVKYNKFGPKRIIKRINMDSWLEFLGYWISEGHLSIKSKKREKYNVFIAQTTKQNLKKIESCLKKLPFNFWYSKDRFIISNQQLWVYLKKFGKSRDKYIPVEFKKLSIKQLKILFNALILGDGRILNNKDSCRFEYTTLSKKLREDIIEIGLKLGYRISTYIYKRKGREEYNIRLSTYSPVTLSNLRRAHISTYNYKGKVYCPELDKNHTLIIEHNGRISLNGNSTDIGIQSLSGALERGHDFVFVQYDNGAYQNTGIQRSGATPYSAWTTTTPVGEIHKGKEEFRKDIMKIVTAHDIPYAAQASLNNLEDLSEKAKKAFETKGPSFINVLQPCTLGWKFPMNLTVEIAQKAVDSCFWPLYEVENGKYKLNYKPKKIPVLEFIKLQGRYKHLLKEKEILDKLQKHVDDKWEELLKLCGENKNAKNS